MGIIFRKTNNLFRDFLSPLECGFISFIENRQPISLRFFVFAVVFVIFDIELILVIPFLIRVRIKTNLYIIFFLIINFLGFGLFLEWNNKAFEWLKFF